MALPSYQSAVPKLLDDMKYELGLIASVEIIWW